MWVSVFTPFCHSLLSYYDNDDDNDYTNLYILCFLLFLFISSSLSISFSFLHYTVSKFTELQRAAVAKEVAEIKKREVAEAKANGTHVEATSNTAGGGKGAGADNSSSNDTKRKFQDKGTASRISLAEFQAKKKLEDEKLRKERAERKKKKYTIVNGPDVVEGMYYRLLLFYDPIFHTIAYKHSLSCIYTTYYLIPS